MKFSYSFNINFMPLGSMCYPRETLAHLYTEVNIATPCRWIHARHVVPHPRTCMTAHKTGTGKQVHGYMDVSNILRIRIKN